MLNSICNLKSYWFEFSSQKSHFKCSFLEFKSISLSHVENFIFIESLDILNLLFLLSTTWNFRTSSSVRFFLHRLVSRQRNDVVSSENEEWLTCSFPWLDSNNYYTSTTMENGLHGLSNRTNDLRHVISWFFLPREISTDFTSQRAELQRCNFQFQSRSLLAIFFLYLSTFQSFFICRWNWRNWTFTFE